MGTSMEYFKLCMFCTCILIFQVMHVTMGDCVYTKTTLSCISADEEEFKYAVQEFQSLVTEKINRMNEIEIKLIDSSIPNDFLCQKLLDVVNERVPERLFEQFQVKLHFSNLGIGVVEVNDIVNVTNVISKTCYKVQLYVNFENNRLIDLSFLKNVENCLYSVTLSNNLFFRLGNIPTRNSFFTGILKFQNCNINYLDGDAFQNFNNLVTLDLSSNKIENLNFSIQNLRTLRTLYLGNNRIENINETEFLHADSLRYLDLEGNNIKTINLFSDNALWYSVIILGRNVNLKEVTIKSKNSIPVLYNVDFSDCDMNEVNNNTMVGFYLEDSLDLTKNNFDTLFPFSFNYTMFSKFVKINLTNSSINNLSENTFNGLVISALNLSYNSIEILQDYTFNNFTSKVLDLSHNQIHSVNVLSFRNAFVNKVILNDNMLPSLDFGIFCSTNTTEIDLFNNKILQFDISFCNNTNPLLSKIILSNNLISKLPNYLSVNTTMFDHLNYLNLSRNLITELNFYETNIYKTLEILDASYNKITIIRPNAFTNMKTLKELHLQGNSLSHISPHAFCNSLNITSLSLSFDNRNGPWRIESKQFSKLGKLVNFTVTNSNISLESNCLYGLISLKAINFNNVSIIGVQPDIFNGSISLRKVNFSTIYNQQKVFKNGFFRGLDDFQNLSINHGNLIEIKYNSFEGLFNLKSLNLSYNNLKELEEGAFIGLKRLENLQLSNNFLESLEKAETFYKLDNLQSLDLSFNRLQFIRNLLFFYLKSLRELIITNNRLRTLDYTEILAFTNIRYLYVEENNWFCYHLETMLLNFSSKSIIYKKNPYSYTYNTTNFDGILCQKSNIYG